MALKGILSKAKLEEKEFIVPPMELQEQFADFVKQVDKTKVALQRSLEKYRCYLTASCKISLTSMSENMYDMEKRKSNIKGRKDKKWTILLLLKKQSLIIIKRLIK